MKPISLSLLSLAGYHIPLNRMLETAQRNSSLESLFLDFFGILGDINEKVAVDEVILFFDIF